MTSQSPRIYTYKITFEEVPYYYYGVHKERRFNEYYVGSPYTNKWCWKLYTPKKQILELFKYSDEGWLQAQEVEKRLIAPVFNTDKWCLNKSCGGRISLDILRKNGKKLIKTRTKEQLSESGRKGAERQRELGVGLYGRKKEKIIEDGRIYGKLGGIKTKELGLGIFALTPEERYEISKMGGRISAQQHKENKTGLWGLTKEFRSNIAKNINAQRWKCLETGFISSPGGLTRYQKARGIDTSNRIRLE